VEGERSASLRHTFRRPDQEGRRLEDDDDTARAAGRGLARRSFADLRRMDPEAGEPVASGDSPCFPDDP
jgi:hypothetical protein